MQSLFSLFDSVSAVHHIDLISSRLFCSGGGTVDFQEFVAGLSAFSNRGEREEKLKCERCFTSLCPTTRR